MRSEQRYDAFLSYARVDDETVVSGAKGDVTKFHAVLELELRKLVAKRDLKIFIDREIQSGLRWRDVLEKQLNEANFMVCMLSPSFFKSTECRAEVNYFVERARAAGHKPKLHPVVIQDLSGVPQDEFFVEMLDHQLVDFTDIKLEAPDSKPFRQFMMAFANQIHATADKVVPIVPTMESMRRELAEAEQDRADLTERVADLTARLSQTADEMPALRDARDQLTRDLENARSIAVAQARDIEDLKRLLSAPSPPSPDVTRLQKELASLHSDRERLVADLARSADSLKKAEQEARTQSAALEKANRDYLASQAKNGELVAQVGALAQSEERLKADLQDASDKAQELQREIRAQVAVAKSAKGVAEKERTTRRDKEAELTQARAELGKLKAEIASLTTSKRQIRRLQVPPWGVLWCLLTIVGLVLLHEAPEVKSMFYYWDARDYPTIPIGAAIVLIIPSLLFFDRFDEHLMIHVVLWCIALIVVLLSLILPASGISHAFSMGFGLGVVQIARIIFFDICVLALPFGLAVGSDDSGFTRGPEIILPLLAGLVYAILAYYSGGRYSGPYGFPLYVAHPASSLTLGLASLLLFTTHVILGFFTSSDRSNLISKIGRGFTVVIVSVVAYSFISTGFTDYGRQEWYWTALQLSAVYVLFGLAWKGAAIASEY